MNEVSNPVPTAWLQTLLRNQAPIQSFSLSLLRTQPVSEALVRAAPTGRYARRIWFLYEWLTGRSLDLPDAGKVRAVPALDPERQFALSRGEMSARHRVIDNLPGTRAFSPLVRRTGALGAAVAKRLGVRAREVIGRTHADVVSRAVNDLLIIPGVFV